MTTQDTAPVGERQNRASFFQAAYLLAALVATLGWMWALGYVLLALLGY